MFDLNAPKILFILGVAILLGACETPAPSTAHPVVATPTKTAVARATTTTTTASPTPKPSNGGGAYHQTGSNL